MIKLCVGVSDVDWLERRARSGQPLIVHTRMTPRRAAEIEDGGSLYWVIKGTVACRQPIHRADRPSPVSGLALSGSQGRAHRSEHR